MHRTSTTVVSARMARAGFVHGRDDEPLLPNLVALAVRGLRRGYLPDDGTFAHTLRPSQSDSAGLEVVGTNLRYAAIAALGLGLLPDEVQREVLDGGTASSLAATTLERARDVDDPGAVALCAWAAAETGAGADRTVTGRMISAAARTLPTVDASWTLTALLTQEPDRGVTGAAADLAQRLLEAQHPSGLFPHQLPALAAQRWRRHVGCFADQVYPIQALARYHLATGDPRALQAAQACAARLCDLQGPAGQWWWHYDVRAGEVVEGYPVYSVHQHAMGPMALMELTDVGGSDHFSAVASGARWLVEHPEVPEQLIAPSLDVVWRSVRRREPSHAMRSVRAVTTSVHQGLRMTALDGLFPPVRIDRECRPYELGWLLYAWLGGAKPRAAVATQVEGSG